MAARFAVGLAARSAHTPRGLTVTWAGSSKTAITRTLTAPGQSRGLSTVVLSSSARRAATITCDSSVVARRFAHVDASGPHPAIAPSTFLRRHKFIRWTLWGSFSIVFGVVATTAIILGHDALTYRHPCIGDVPTSQLALHPKPGGPKNLPIVTDYIEGDEDEIHQQLKGKERLVIVGGGWAAVSLLSKLDVGKYNITLVSPSNFYLL